MICPPHYGRLVGIVVEGLQWHPGLLCVQITRCQSECRLSAFAQGFQRQRACFLRGLLYVPATATHPAPTCHRPPPTDPGPTDLHTALCRREMALAMTPEIEMLPKSSPRGERRKCLRVSGQSSILNMTSEQGRTRRYKHWLAKRTKSDDYSAGHKQQPGAAVQERCIVSISGRHRIGSLDTLSA